jgi:uncharacterized protein (TIGR02996 family)
MIDALLAKVYEDPADDAARLVYADAVGGKRGELIVLQMRPELSRVQKRRERELLAGNAHGWLGPLGAHITKVGLRYRRGFPAAGLLTPQRIPPAIMEHPAWATFEELTADREAEDLLASPRLRRLKILHGASPVLAARLATDEPARELEALTIIGDAERAEDAVGMLAGRRMLPKLRALEFPGRLRGMGYIGGLVGRGLELVSFAVARDLLADAMTAALRQRRRPPILRVRQRDGGWRLDLSHDDALTAMWQGPAPGARATPSVQLRQALRGLEGRFKTISVGGLDDAGATARVAARLRRAGE